MNTRTRVIGAIAVLTALAGSPAALAQVGSSDWRWSITPYLWGTDITVDVEFPVGQEIGTETTFDEILDKLDFAVLVHVEAQRGAWGGFFDATYLSMSDDTDHGPISAESEIETGLYELAALYAPGGDRGFGAFAGVRLTDLTLDMTFSGAGPGGPIQRSTDSSLTDFMVGARYAHSFNDQWLLHIRADIGAGDTDSSWNALALVGWRFGSDLDNSVLFGWRHMAFAIEEERSEVEVTFDGPIVGVKFGL